MQGLTVDRKKKSGVKKSTGRKGKISTNKGAIANNPEKVESDAEEQEVLSPKAEHLKEDDRRAIQPTRVRSSRVKAKDEKKSAAAINKPRTDSEFGDQDETATAKKSMAKKAWDKRVKSLPVEQAGEEDIKTKFAEESFKARSGRKMVAGKQAPTTAGRKRKAATENDDTPAGAEETGGDGYSKKNG